MILIGDAIIPYEDVVTISKLEEIKKTRSNSLLLFKFDAEIMAYCKNNSLKYGVIVSSIKEAIYANALMAKYIISDISMAEKVQKIAQNYMFDGRILAIIEQDSQIEAVAFAEIDGAIYKHIIGNI